MILLEIRGKTISYAAYKKKQARQGKRRMSSDRNKEIGRPPYHKLKRPCTLGSKKGGAKTPETAKN